MSRYEQLRWMVFLLLAVVVARLGYLQIFQAGHYRALSDRNRIRYVPEPAPRGLIYDRKGRVIASNQTLFQAAIVPQESDDLDYLLNQVGMVLGESFETLRKRFRRNRGYSFVSAPVTRHLDKDKALALEEERWRLPGLIVQPVIARRYPFGKEVSHVLGYLSKPKPGEVERLKAYGVLPQYMVGRTGIEQLYDSILRGSPGDQVVEVNHRGHRQRILRERKAVPGRSIKLTVDASLQSLIATIFQDHPGACVVLDPRTGEVLAMVSNPSFDPEAFAVSDSEKIRGYLADENLPLLNRATYGVYPPGSIAKIIVASAALEEGMITKHTKINCEGHMRIGDRIIHCWYRDGHGYLELVEAIRYSCNVYFMRVGCWLGLEKLLSVYTRVGFSQATGWPLGERVGSLPTRRLSQGEVAMLSIGQGPIDVTPLQVAMMISMFANNGWIIQPWIVQEIDGKPITKQANRYRIGWDQEIFRTIREGLKGVVNDFEGTGHRAFTEEVEIAGKTGTAQTHKPNLNHGWFAGFCPADEPRAAFAIVAEYGGSGGDLPAQVGRAVCEYISATSFR